MTSNTNRLSEIQFRMLSKFVKIVPMLKCCSISSIIARLNTKSLIDVVTMNICVIPSIVSARSISKPARSNANDDSKG